jgi:phosphatidylserine/phosphatidylglycerophosphate/cardiolipin synthase-like enzyme
VRELQAEIEARIDRGLGDFLVKPLREAKQRVWVMSPWLSANYTSLLIEKKSKGVDVRVITTDDYTPAHRKALRALIESEKELIRPENRRMKLVGMILIIAGIIFSILTFGLSLAITVVGIIVYYRGKELFMVRFTSKIGDDNLIVYHSDPHRLIHAKVYVADDQVGFGSANLTKEGTEENVESLVWVESPKLVEQILEELGDLEKKLGLKRISINEVGRAVTEEARRRK